MFWRMPYLSHRTAIVFAAVVSSIATAQTPATGVHPRATPADYAASRQTNGTTYAAALVSADQVRHIFASDITKSYVVFELAVYPPQPGSTVVSPDDFLVKTGGNSEFVHPADAATIASVIQQKNMPPRRVDHTSDVVTSAGVGYETGTDPYTGRRVHDTYTEIDVGVGAAPKTFPPPPPRAGSSPQDRQLLENQLADKALPKGSFPQPVAGFLYFPAASLKKPKGDYHLQYLSDASGRVDLVIPAKAK